MQVALPYIHRLRLLCLLHRKLTVKDVVVQDFSRIEVPWVYTQKPTLFGKGARTRNGGSLVILLVFIRHVICSRLWGYRGTHSKRYTSQWRDNSQTSTDTQSTQVWDPLKRRRVQRQQLQYGRLASMASLTRQPQTVSEGNDRQEKGDREDSTTLRVERSC